MLVVSAAVSSGEAGAFAMWSYQVTLQITKVLHLPLEGLTHEVDNEPLLMLSYLHRNSTCFYRSCLFYPSRDLLLYPEGQQT